MPVAQSANTGHGGVATNPVRETSSSLRHLRHLRHCVARIDPGSHAPARETSSTVRHLRHFRHLRHCVGPIDPGSHAPARETPSTLRHLRHCVTRTAAGKADRASETWSTVRHLRHCVSVTKDSTALRVFGSLVHVFAVDLGTSSVTARRVTETLCARVRATWLFVLSRGSSVMSLIVN
jgi:hypothetical protein